MFANFELFSAGLVSVEQKPKCRRSHGACEPCRRRRKRCDERRPICGGCLARRASCQWRNNSSSLLENHNTPTGSEVVTPPSDSPDSCDSTTGPGEGDHSASRETRLSSEPSQGRALNSISIVFRECFQGLPSCSMIGLLQVLDNAMSRIDLGSEFSMLSQGFESLSNSRLMLHAWLACSSIVISQFQPGWRIHALRLQASALRELSSTISDENGPERDSDLAAVLLLHVFERFDSSSRNSNSILSKAASMWRTIHQSPRNSHSLLMLETLIYHLAINSTFRPSYLPHYQDLSNLIGLWSNSPLSQPGTPSDLSGKAGVSAWFPLDFFDIIFKTSYLLHRRHSLSVEHILIELGRLKTVLRSLQYGEDNFIEALDRWPSHESLTMGQSWDSQGPDALSTKYGTESFHLRRIYSLAIYLLIAKLETPLLAAHDPMVANLVKIALFDLHRIRPDFTSLLWPTIIIGTGVVSTKDQNIIVAQLEAMHHYAGERSIRSIFQFLSYAWGVEISQNCTETNGVLRSEWALGDKIKVAGDKVGAFGLDILLQGLLLSRVVL